MKRKKLRRLRRVAAALGLTVEQMLAWQRRELPEDHPVDGAEPQPSDEQLGRRMIRVVERSGALEHLQRRWHKRRGRKRKITVKALLVAVELTAHLCGSYRRSDVCAVLAGLHPATAAELGLVDSRGRPIIVKYKTVARSLRLLEWWLRLGWYSDDVRCDLGWITHAMVAASVPRRVRRTTTAVAVDSTPVPGWAVPRVYTRQADLNAEAKRQLKKLTRIAEDPDAKYRRDVVDDPDIDEPDLERRALAAAAKKLGAKIGPDGRLERGRDPDMRVGWATATAKRPAHFFVGYELTVVIACRTIAWQGNPRHYQMGPKVTHYVLAMTLTPAGTNPGPVGCEAVMKAKEIAPNIREVIADRAYTVKRETFLQPLHRLDINVVMDYPSPMVKKTDEITLGKRKHPALSHCGTILPTWTPFEQLVPPKRLTRKCETEQERQQLREERQEWYADRAESRYRTNGRSKNGRRQLKSPVNAGRFATPGKPSPAGYGVPLVAPDADSGESAKVNALVEDLDFFQDHPHGTPVWYKSYHRRSTVESVIGKLKKLGLGIGDCQAFGLTANTLAAVAVVVVYNRRRAAADKRKKRKKLRKRAAARRAAATSQTASPDPGARTPGADGDAPLRAPP